MFIRLDKTPKHDGRQTDSGLHCVQCGRAVEIRGGMGENFECPY